MPWISKKIRLVFINPINPINPKNYDQNRESCCSTGWRHSKGRDELGPYFDDLFVTADSHVGACEKGKEHLTSWGLEAKTLTLCSLECAHGSWLVRPDSPITIWTDPNKIAISVTLEVDGDVEVDAAWLQPQDSLYQIYRTELNAIVRIITSVLKWRKRKMTVKTDSSACHGWLKAIVDQTHNLRVKGFDKIKADPLRNKCDYESDVCTSLWSTRRLMWCPDQGPNEVVEQLQVSLLCQRHGQGPISHLEIKQVHELNHFGVARTLHERAYHPRNPVSRKGVKKFVSGYEQCQWVHSSPKFEWDRGDIFTGAAWDKMLVDVEESGDVPYLQSYTCFPDSQCGDGWETSLLVRLLFI